MRITPRRTILAAVAVASIGAGLASVDHADAFLHRVLKPVVQTISLSVKRGQEYERLEAQRDDLIAGAEQAAQATEWQIANGWITDPEVAERERTRYSELNQAITDRTEREKRLTRAQYNRAIGSVWREAAIEAITQVPGLNPRAGRALQSILRGEGPLEAALAAVVDGGARPDEIEVLQQEWAEAKDALRQIRLPQAEGLLGKMQLLVEGSEDPLGTLAGRSGFNAAAQEMREALDQFRAVVAEWTVRGAGVDTSRFQGDAQWQRLTAHIAGLEQSTAGKALLAGMARQTIERVRLMAEEHGLDLDEGELLTIAAAASSAGIASLVESRANGGPFDLDFDPIIRGAINEWLATAGLDPLPEPLSGELTLPQTTRVGETVTLEVRPTGGGTVTDAPDYEVAWYVEPIPLPISGSRTLTRAFAEPGEQVVRVVVTDNTSGQTVEATAPIEVLGPLAVTIAPLGVFGQEGDVLFNPTPEAPLTAVYAGEVVRYTALVDGIAPGTRPLVEWIFPDGTVTEVEPGSVSPALRQAGRRGWYTDHAIDEPGSYLVRVSVADPDTGATASTATQVEVIAEPEDPNAWHAAQSCRVEGEGEGYEFRWTVRITEEADDGEVTYFADVYYHDCPGGGRAHYRGEATPVGVGRWEVAELQLRDGRGRLGLLAQGERPGPFSSVLTAGAAPSPNVIAELGR